MFQQQGFDLVNYLDDCAGAEVESLAWTAYNALTRLLSDCGLQENVFKACCPVTIMVFLGVLFNTITLTLEITPERLEETIELLRICGDKSLCNKEGSTIVNR